MSLAKPRPTAVPLTDSGPSQYTTPVEAVVASSQSASRGASSSSIWASRQAQAPARG